MKLPEAVTRVLRRKKAPPPAVAAPVQPPPEPPETARAMPVRRLVTAFRKQDWFTVAIETLIVVLGVFLGIQLGNWNEARAAKARRGEIVQALVTDLQDTNYVVTDRAIPAVEAGLAAWETSYSNGETPVPFYFRIDGSDTPPDTWNVLQQMDVAGLFDPVTLFDLNMYYSELEGVAVKYIRYVTFVEEEILPYETGDPRHFYMPDGATLKPEFLANMERLREWQGELSRLSLWGTCLTERLKSGVRPEQSCLRSDPSISAASPLAIRPREDAP